MTTIYTNDQKQQQQTKPKNENEQKKTLIIDYLLARCGA